MTKTAGERQRYVSVIGAGEPTASQAESAYEVGREIARAGHILVCGGLAGVMEAAARGAAEAGGISLGILPDDDRSKANPYITVSIPTGFSHGRNYLVVKSGDGVIAVGGGAGTLSEIGLAIKLGRPLVLVDSLDVNSLGVPGAELLSASGPAQAVAAIERAWHLGHY